MSQVAIKMDPHKRSATIEIIAGDEAISGGGRYATHAAGVPGDAGGPALFAQPDKMGYTNKYRT